MKQIISLETRVISEIAEAKHVFTHKTWLMTLYEIRNASVLEEENLNRFYGRNAKTAWVTLEGIEEYAMATAFKKLLKHLN
jgi:adenine-specific DNA glycosylase